MTSPELDTAALFAALAESSLKGESVDAILSGFCEQLNVWGFGIRRGHVSAATVDPAVNAYSVTWKPDAGVEHDRLRHGRPVNPGWLASPFHHMLTTRSAVLRRRLAGQGAQLDFPILEQLAAEGMTEWFARLVNFHWAAAHIQGGQMGMLTSWATDQPQGFSEAQIALLDRLIVALAAAVKAATISDMAREVLAAYVGRDAATRVLSGAITRGSVQRLEAVLFFADLRDFTRFSAARPIADVVALLNDVFDRVATPIRAHGGEILKFIGDGLLAVFLLDGSRSTAATADAALAAAVAAQQAVRAASAAPSLDIALHVGEVHYGNIGAAGRLDFTVIGSAVNEVARLEELCGVLDEPILVSTALRAVAQSMADRLSSRGHHQLRGTPGTQEIFAVTGP
jgi:adenylate cyclase